MLESGSALLDMAMSSDWGGVFCNRLTKLKIILVHCKAVSFQTGYLKKFPCAKALVL